MEPDVGVSVPPSALREKWQKKKKKSQWAQGVLSAPRALTQAVPSSGNAFPAGSYSFFDYGPPQLLCLPWSQHTPYSLFHDPGLASPPDSEYHVGRPWPT